MLTRFSNIIGRAFQPQQVTTVQTPTYSNNPFANPFVSNDSTTRQEFYGKNKPVRGGFFAGYHNGKPNIVGRRLFVEV